MPDSLEFILGLLDRYQPAFVSAEDFSGAHGLTLEVWQRLGFLRTEPERHPCRAARCRKGVPHLLGGRYICDSCQSTVDRRHLLRWRFDLESLLQWVARMVGLNGDVRQVDEQFWHLGNIAAGSFFYTCFFHQGEAVPERGRRRLLAYRNAVLLGGLPQETPIAGFAGPCLSLLEMLRQGRGTLEAIGLKEFLRGRGAVRFEEASGAVWVRDAWLGEVPVGSKEYHFLACLAGQLDRFVTYADIKHYVLQQSGGTDTADDATFCQKLKSRIKAKGWVRRIDLLVVTTQKGDGYRLRGHVEL